MTRKNHGLPALALVLAPALALAMAGPASGQLFDGQYWEAGISGKTQIIVGATSGDPEQAQLLKGRLKKEKVYLLSSWDGGSETYTLDAWTNSGGAWVRADDAGTLAPFGDGFPDSKNGAIDLTLDLTPTPTSGAPSAEGGGSPGVVINVTGVLALKFKVDKKAEDLPGVDEVQELQTGSASGGTFVLSFDGAVTAALAYDITAGELQTALQGLGTLGAGNLLVRGAVPSYTLTFTGALSQSDVSSILVDNDSTTGGTGVSASVITPGMSPVLKALKKGAFDLIQIGSSMTSNDFAGVGNEMTGTPKLQAKRVLEDKLPFVPSGS